MSGAYSHVVSLSASWRQRGRPLTTLVAVWFMHACTQSLNFEIDSSTACHALTVCSTLPAIRQENLVPTVAQVSADLTLDRNYSMLRQPTVLLAAACVVTVRGGDPSTTWEAFAVCVPPAAGPSVVTAVSCTYIVPSRPRIDDGSTPKWWVGLQSSDGNGTLMKPQITWQNSSWQINTEVLDYSLTPPLKVLSPTVNVSAGDFITASVHDLGNGTYELAIGRVGAPPVSSQLYAPRIAETRAYAVMEHQPVNCAALPREGRLDLDVQVAVGAANHPVASWTAMPHLPACGARSVVLPRSHSNSTAISFTWRTLKPED